jgi:hypothetical protein
MKPHPYLILVDGDLETIDQSWLADLMIGRTRENHMALSGNLDQAALLGVLGRLQYLALEVVEVRRLCDCLSTHHSAAGHAAC